MSALRTQYAGLNVSGEIPYTSRRVACLQRGRSVTLRSIDMPKGQQQKKQDKKKPAKTFEEKRAAKREKKANLSTGVEG
jgi:hypothetical protein